MNWFVRALRGAGTGSGSPGGPAPTLPETARVLGFAARRVCAVRQLPAAMQIPGAQGH